MVVCLCPLPVLFALVLGRGIAIHPYILTENLVLPRLLLVPHEGKGLDAAGFVEGRKSPQRLGQNLLLQLRLMGFAGGVAEWEIQEGRPGWIDGSHDVVGRAHAQRRNAGLLGLPGDQSHGLMADGSARHQEGQVRALDKHLFDQAGGQFLAHAPG